MKQALFTMLLCLLLIFSAHSQSSGGTYLPTVTISTTLINPIPQIATYTRNDSIVTVYGTIYLNGFPNVGSPVQIGISVPIPTNFSIPPSMVRGLGEVAQSTNGYVPAIINSDFIKPIIHYTPSSSFPANLYYHFQYLVH